MTVATNPGLTLTVQGDTEILISRHFNGTPEQLFRAHTEPALLQRWCLGPEGWSMPVCICEARAGGRLRYEWRKGDRGFYVTGEFISLTPYSRIEHVERMHLPDVTPDCHVTTEFAPEGSGTRMVMRMQLPDAATRNAMVASGMADGMETSYLRLDAHTQKLPA